MRNLFFATLGFSLVLLSGCALIFDTVAEKVAEGVDVYCSLPGDQRAVYSGAINRALSTHGRSIVIGCADDQSGLLSK